MIFYRELILIKPFRNRNLHRNRNSLSCQEVPSEDVTIDNLEDLPVNVHINTNVEVPHGQILAPGDPGTRIRFSWAGVEWYLMSPNYSSLGHAGVSVGGLHDSHRLILQVKVEFADSSTENIIIYLNFLQFLLQMP